MAVNTEHKFLSKVFCFFVFFFFWGGGGGGGEGAYFLCSHYALLTQFNFNMVFAQLSSTDVAQNMHLFSY